MALKPPYFQAESFSAGIRRMMPSTWPLLVGFGVSAFLMMYAHSKLANDPGLRAKSGYLRQLEAAQGKKDAHEHGHEAHH